MTETDAGTTTYAYRKDGSIRFSQNAKQLHERTFSYTNYDQLGRPVESGQLPLATGEEFNDLKSTAALAGIGDAFSSARTRTDWIKTYYDLPDETNSGFVQNFVRGGVSWSENENAMTWYSYDELGRVVSTKQFIKGPKIATTNTYKYDFLGNVLTMNASPTIGASITYTYQYDRERRLKSVNVKTDKIDKLIARYEYYLHGPLKRIELGEKLQGIDYVYNIHGWLTQINHPNVSEDPGADGAAGDHAEFKEDVFGLALNYYESTIQNLYAKVAAPSDELLKRHHFPAGFMAYTKPSTVSSVAGAENWFTPAQNEHGRANMGTLQAPSLQNLSTK